MNAWLAFPRLVLKLIAMKEQQHSFPEHDAMIEALPSPLDTRKKLPLPPLSFPSKEVGTSMGQTIPNNRSKFKGSCKLQVAARRAASACSGYVLFRDLLSLSDKSMIFDSLIFNEYSMIHLVGEGKGVDVRSRP